MRGSLVAQLNDPFAKVRLVHDVAVSFQLVVELGFLARHGLGFDDALDAFALGNIGDDLVGFFGCVGTVHMGAALFGLGLELQIELFHVGSGLVLEVAHSPDKALFVHIAHHVRAIGTVVHSIVAKSLAKLLVVESLVDLFMVGAVALGCCLHYLVLQEKNVQGKGAMDADSTDAFDVGSTAGAGDEGGEGRALTNGFTHDVGHGRQVGVDGRFLQREHADFADHAGQTHILVRGGAKTGAAGCHAGHGLVEAKVDTGSVFADVVAQTEDTLLLAKLVELGKGLVIERRCSDHSLHAGGNAVGAEGALFGTRLVGQKLTGFLGEGQINNVFEGLFPVGDFCHSGSHSFRHCGKFFDKFGVCVGHVDLLCPCDSQGKRIWVRTAKTSCLHRMGVPLNAR